MPQVKAICIGARKGEPKQSVDSAIFRAGHGIESDVHGGPWHRQISLLAEEDIEGMRRQLPQLRPGAFAENVVLAGMDLGACGVGTRIRLGSSVVLSVTQIGKVCHSPCAISQATGDCLMPRRGVFARVEAGGKVRVGEPAEILEHVPREWFQAVVLTVSDRCAAGEAQDTAGPAVADLLRESLPLHVYRVEIVPDERPLIARRLKHYCSGHSIDLVTTVGGTGMAPRDVTPEAARDVIERFTPGLDEAMRRSSMSATPHAMLSRGVSGIRGATLILSLPGSRRAAVENLAAVLPALKHGLEKLRGDPSDCGRAPVGPSEQQTGGAGP
jgi:molybdopterin adenylyltransferase